MFLLPLIVISPRCEETFKIILCATLHLNLKKLRTSNYTFPRWKKYETPSIGGLRFRRCLTQSWFVSSRSVEVVPPHRRINLRPLAIQFLKSFAERDRLNNIVVSFS